MWIKFRHKVVFTLLRPFFIVFFWIKYRTTVKKVKLNKEPYLILSNHLTTLDPFIVGLAFLRPIYYMASEDLSSSKYGKLITWLVNPIYKAKSKTDLGAIKDCLRVTREGGTICIFPEGNRSFDGQLCHIDESIVKLVKLLKIPVVLFNINGGYGTDPRWANKGRRGKSSGTVRMILSVEEISNMSNEELFKVIIDGLTVNSVPTAYKYKSKKNAEGLERILYLCPKCNSLNSIFTKKNYLYCSKCNLRVKYTNQLEFETEDLDFKFKYVKDWYSYQKNYIKSFNSNTKFFYEDENVTLLLMEKNKKGKPIKNGKLSMDNAFLSIDDIQFNLSNIENMTMVGKRKMNFYFDNKTYQLKRNLSINLIKYYHMYHHFYKKEGIDHAI